MKAATPPAALPATGRAQPDSRRRLTARRAADDRRPCRRSSAARCRLGHAPAAQPGSRLGHLPGACRRAPDRQGPPAAGALPPAAAAAVLRPDAPAAQPPEFLRLDPQPGHLPGRDRWVGGVASGIAQRLGVDPLIVRGILIVLTVFAGIGVLLYGIAWALLPEPDGRIHVQEAAAGRWSSGMTGALITTVIGFPSLGGGVWGWDRYGFGAFIWTVFWVGGAIYLIYYLTQRNKTRNGVTPMSSQSAARRPGGPRLSRRTAPAGAYAAGPHRRSFVRQRAGYGRRTPLPRYGAPCAGPAWRSRPRLGRAPALGPVPPAAATGRCPGGGPVPPAKPRNFGPGAPAVAVTAGLALLVGGGIKALDVANVIDLGTSGNAVVWASAAAVLGLGILVAGLRGRTSGILGFFAVVALIVGGIFNVLPQRRPVPLPERRLDTGRASSRPATASTSPAGTGTVDLTGLALNPPLGTDVVVPIDATASNLTVVIPDNVPVEVRADMTMGNLNEGSQSHGGMTTRQSNYNTGKPGAPLIVEIDGTFSNVTIKEGN